MSEENSKILEVIEKVLQGDLEAYGSIIKEYEDKLKRFILSAYNIDKEDAEDIIQDTFIKAYTNLADYDTNMSFSAWIYRIARNTAIDFLRKHNKSKKLELETLDLEFLSESGEDKSLLELADEKINASLLYKALFELKPEQREILLLYFFEHKSYLEIADILQAPVGTVKTKLHRAKKALRQILKDRIHHE